MDPISKQIVVNPAHFNLVVVGAGSGGIGAALSAARNGLSVLLAEKSDSVGGNATRSGVHCWEPGAGGTGIPFEIYKRLKRIPNAVGIYRQNRHISWRLPGDAEFPVGGENILDPSLKYLDSLLRHGVRADMTREEMILYRRNFLHGVVFEPDAYCQVVEEMIEETGQITLKKGTAFRSVVVRDRQILSMELDDGSQVSADFFVDSTANVVLAEACGCEMMLGQESVDFYHEPDAPAEPTRHLNGTTLIYRVAPAKTAEIEPLLAEIPENCWWRPDFPITAVNVYPNGDLNLNMLPTMEGLESFEMGYPAAYAECRRRVLAHWHHLQKIFPDYQNFRLKWIAPALGIRETRRVVGKYILTEHDLLAGLSKQEHRDIITIADHAMDTHGAATHRAGINEMKEPYGIPFRCLLARDIDNLMIACRGASFSSLAASSCRLSRTMIQLGQAAGTAAALALSQEVPLEHVPPDLLREQLQKQQVQLDWPYPHHLLAYLKKE